MKKTAPKKTKAKPAPKAQPAAKKAAKTVAKPAIAKKTAVAKKTQIITKKVTAPAAKPAPKAPAKAKQAKAPAVEKPKNYAQPASKPKASKNNSANSISLQKGKKKDMAELTNQYTEESIRSLDWREHIRLRPGMYIGKLGDGSSMDDGIYILIKEVVDNCIDEYTMGYGKSVELSIKDGTVTVRDYGRGIPLGKVVDVVSKINTGAKYDSKAFQKSVGLNGVGTKAVNALSTHFKSPLSARAK
jgi:hypothetical protein